MKFIKRRRIRRPQKRLPVEIRAEEPPRVSVDALLIVASLLGMALGVVFWFYLLLPWLKGLDK
jgi:hypothetical protein